ncbi:polysaccharide deacetylase family protein [Nitratireductor soli]|uniref:polysaccharide deacetylase family protein n=1 Tax=Nitratireductor soli TaxID=1670619 RepID=UPI00065DD429|nr:polysaccharide deacetylase family protein [Nitratireductor soli]
MRDSVGAPPQEHNRFEFSAITDRPKLEWPEGARVALWVIPNVEHFLFDRPSSSIIQSTTGFVPDVLNYAWRDYGVRVGIWRMMEIMERYGVKGTVALNSDVCAHYPSIIEAGNSLDWEWMGHGRNNSSVITGIPEIEERKIVQEAVSTITQATGIAPRGWLSPALTETHQTPDILAENGIRYLADWTNDDQPYEMRVRSGTMLAMPYSVEMNDYTAFLEQGLSGKDFGDAICDQFDQLYADGASTGRVMSLCLHPFLIGQPHRAKHFARALKYITSHDGVWLAKGGEIADWYSASVPTPQRPSI